MRVTDAGNVPLALAPSASVSLSRKALLSGRIAPESVDLISPRLSLFYSEDGTLALKFATPAEPAESERAKAPAPARRRAEAPAAPRRRRRADGGLGRIDLVKVLSEASARARRREHASAYLREIGLKSATVIIDNGGRKSIWRVPELDVDLDHRRSRSSIAGRAKIESLAGPWTLNFRTYEHEAANKLQLAVSVQGLVPRGLARSLPQLAGLESLDVPVWGEAKLDLSSTGEILSGTIGIDAAPGQVLLPWLAATPLRIDGGHLALSYDRAARRFDDRALGAGVGRQPRAVHRQRRAHRAGRRRARAGPSTVKSAGGWIGAEPPLLPQLTDRRLVGARVLLAGARPGRAQPVPAAGRRRGGVRRGRRGGHGRRHAGAPRRQDRADAGQHLQDAVARAAGAALARLGGASIWCAAGCRAAPSGSPRGAGAAGSGWAATTGPEQRLADAGGGQPRLQPRRQLADARGAARARAARRAAAFEMRVPDATMSPLPTAASSRLKGTFTIDMKEPLPRTGRVALRGQGPLSVALEMLDRRAVPPAAEGRPEPWPASTARSTAQLTVSFPLGQALEPRDVKVEGKTRITEARLGQALGPYEVHGANITIDMTPTAAEAKGEMLINGVVAKASWQHVFAAPADKQPPLAHHRHARQQLPQPARARHQRPGAGRRRRRGDGRRAMRAASAACTCAPISSMPRSCSTASPGASPRASPACSSSMSSRAAAAYPIELLNVKLVGDDVAIEGWMGIGADNKRQGVPLPQLLAQRRHQPRDARQGAPRRRLGRDRQGPHLRRPRPLPLLLRRRPPGRPERQGAAGPRPAAPRSTPWSASPTPRCAT